MILVEGPDSHIDIGSGEEIPLGIPVNGGVPLGANMGAVLEFPKIGLVLETVARIVGQSHPIIKIYRSEYIGYRMSI